MPIVLLPGFMLTRDLWLDILPELASYGPLFQVFGASAIAQFVNLSALRQCSRAVYDPHLDDISNVQSYMAILPCN